MKTYNQDFVQGDTILLPISWVDSSNTAITFNSRTIRFSVRETEDSDTTLFDKNSNDHPDAVKNLEITDATKKGILEIKITSAETALFPRGDLPYNLEVTDQDGFRRTILRGRLMMIADIAR